MKETLEVLLCKALRQTDSEQLECERDLQQRIYDKLIEAGWRVYPEVDVSFELSGVSEALIKKKVDLLAEKNGRRVVLELKVPLNKAYPKRMCHAMADIAFLEQLKRLNRHFTEAYFIMLVKDHGFYQGKADKPPYVYFRGGLRLPLREVTLNFAYQGCHTVCFHRSYRADWSESQNGGRFLCLKV